MTTVLKLGGSLVTEKTEEATVAEDRLARIADTIARSDPGSLVIIHGGGSFGHPAASRHGVSRTEGTRSPTAIEAISRSMARLNERVVSSLCETGVPAVAWPPRACASKRRDGDTIVGTGPLASALTEGFVPVVYGDIVCHEGAGCSILGGDELAVAIGTAMDADRIGLCAGVAGVLDAAGTVMGRIERIEDVTAVFDAPEGIDVTGGMEWKVQMLLDTDISSAIFGIDSLPGFLDGELPGTRVG